MAFQWGETPKSRTFDGETLTLEYFANGEVNEQSVYAFALANTSAVWVTATHGTLYRQDPQLSPVGANHFTVSVPYNRRKKEHGSFSFSFDTTGGTANRKAARTAGTEYSAANPAGIPRVSRSIGEDGDHVEGAEVVIPALKLTVQFRHPLGIVTLAKVKQLADNTGKSNSTPFLTFAAGEVLFLGATGNDGTDVDAEVSYQFVCSPNEVNLDFGGIVVASKKGWQYIHFKWGNAKDADNKPIKQIDKIYVDDLYEEADLAGILGFGS